MRIICGEDMLMAQWAAERIPAIDRVQQFGPLAALGVWDETREEIAAVIVYHDYQERFGTMQLSMAADTPRWAQKGIIRAALHYPFEQLGVQKLWTCTAASNQRALKFNRGVGFRQEAILARHYGDEHAVIMRMFDKDYRRRYAQAQEAQYADA